jgi:hypothetical protein
MRLFTEKRGNPKTAKNKAHSVILHLSQPIGQGLKYANIAHPAAVLAV